MEFFKKEIKMEEPLIKSIQYKKELELLESGEFFTVRARVLDIIPSNRTTEVKTVKCELLNENKNEPVYFAKPHQSEEEKEAFYGMINKQVDFLVQKNVTLCKEIYFNIIGFRYEKYRFYNNRKASCSNKLYLYTDVVIDKIIQNRNDTSRCDYQGRDENGNEIRLFSYNKELIEEIGDKKGCKLKIFYLKVSEGYFNVLSID